MNHPTITVEQAKDLATLAAGATLAIRAARAHVPDQYYNLLPSGAWSVGFQCGNTCEAYQVADLLNAADYSAAIQDDSWVAVTLEPLEQPDETGKLRAEMDMLKDRMAAVEHRLGMWGR